jgi:hypothetical protein
MGEEPSEIRQEIEDTRARMSDRADALAYKADVPARTKDKVANTKDRIVGKISGHTPSRDEVTGQAKGQAKKAKSLAEDNPLGLAIGGVAVGFLAGLLVPSSAVEDEKIGPLADQVKDRARDLGSEALEHGKQVAGQAVEAARDTAQQAGQEHAEELRDSARDQSNDVVEHMHSN